MVTIHVSNDTAQIRDCFLVIGQEHCWVAISCYATYESMRVSSSEPFDNVSLSLITLYNNILLLLPHAYVRYIEYLLYRSKIATRLFFCYLSQTNSISIIDQNENTFSSPSNQSYK